MPPPLVLGLVGSAVVVVAALLNWRLIGVRRYDLDRVGFDGQQPELRRLVVDQGRISMLAFVGASIQFVALIWSTGI